MRWTYVMGDGKDVLNYIQAETEEDLAMLGEHQFVKPQTADDWASLDVVIVTTHGSDLSASLAALRSRAPGALIALWLWDNHVAQVNNLHTVLGGDIYFPSHRYNDAYLSNAAALHGGQIPACSAQWARAHVRRLFDESVGVSRDGHMLMNYVDYNWSWRSGVIKSIADNVPEATVITMPAHDRSRYFLKASAERFREWLGYKSTLILPLDSDLSTRFFDAMLAGLVPIVPLKVADFDAVVSPQEQKRLGIVRIADFEVATLRAAAIEAAATFDAMGDAGVRARHDLVAGQHMIADRFGAMLDACQRAGSEDFAVTYGSLDGQRPALHNVHVRR
ncbi:MAG: hypothetical protein M3N82_04595 [Pseudomonadota bacterium]|nr:hypothetical protein [Pseudomonadota bacterium]